MNTLLDATLNPFVGILQKSGLLAKDWDYHLLRASMVIIFLFFGYQKWWEYEAERLIPLLAVSLYLLKQDLVRVARIYAIR